MIEGIAISEGVAIGFVKTVGKTAHKFEEKSPADPESETKRFEKALESFCDNMKKQAKNIKETAGEEHAKIIEGHILMVKDPYMQSDTRKKIFEGSTAEKAFSDVCDDFRKIFLSSGDQLTMERAADVIDIKNGVLAELNGEEIIDFSMFPENTVLVADELTPSAVSSAGKNIVGIVTAVGGPTSHFAILARAMGIPTVSGINEVTKKLKDGEKIVIDGSNGLIIPSPDSKTEKKYETEIAEMKKAQAENEMFRNRPTVTADGVPKKVFCNIGDTAEADLAAKCGGEGVGLFRTEFMLADSKTVPSEEQQFENYKKTVSAFGGDPLIIRTFDVGGDKKYPCLNNAANEENPFLGLRGIRFLFKHENLLRTQIRAVLRASAFGEIGLMIPLVTSVEEVTKFKEIYREECENLKSENEEIGSNVKLGVMIETPAASLIAPLLAKEVDFFSIGTNDLVQYTMAADRGNSSVEYLSSPFFPAVIRSLKLIIESGEKAGIAVGMCGEAAANPLLIPVLIGLGLEEFSVNPRAVLRTRREISKWCVNDCKKIAEKVLAFSEEKEVKEYLKSLHKKTQA